MLEIFLTICVISVVSIAWYIRHQQGRWRSLKVPGPRPSFPIGIFSLYKEKGIGNTDLTLLNEYGKVVGVYHGYHQTLLVMCPDAAKEICSTKSNIFINRYLLEIEIARKDHGQGEKPVYLGPFLTRSVTLSDGEQWSRMRTTFKILFSSERMEKACKVFSDTIGDCLTSKVSDTKENLEIDIRSLCEEYSAEVLLRLFVNPSNTNKLSRQELQCLVKDAWAIGQCKSLHLAAFFGAVIPGFRTFLRLINFPRIPAHIIRQFQQIAEEYLKSNTSLDATVDDVAANLLFFIMAGFDTTASTLMFLLHALATHSEIQEQLYKELSKTLSCPLDEIPESDRVKVIDSVTYLDQCVSETLRLYPSMLRFNRLASETTEIAGYQVDAGTDVTVSTFGLHRDPDVWPDPDTFDPDRFTASAVANRSKYSYLPFGAGPRSCFPQHYALLSIKIAAITILTNFALSLPDSSKQTSLTLDKGLYARPVDSSITLKFSRR